MAIILSAVLVVLLVIQAVFYIIPAIGLSKIKNNGDENFPKKKLGVSVIIACRNELQNLKSNLKYITEQQYPQFEIIVVDDNSTDGSFEYLNSLQTDLIRVFKNDESGKKSALTLGIEKAKYDFLIFTDADCRPASEMWISSMMNCFDDSAQIILGYGELSGKNFISWFSSYDALIIALQYCGFAVSGNPYMAVGRNIAYSKKLWNEVGGFSSHKEIRSGDDDLFLREAVKYTNANICISVNSKTISPAKTSFSELLRQKSRHVSASVKYSLKEKFLSGGEIISRAMFFAVAVFLAFFSWQTALLLVVLRIIFVFVALISFSRKTNTSTNPLLLMIFDIFAPFFYAILLMYKLLNCKSEW